MAAILMGERAWEGARDREGVREYKLTSLIVTTDTDDGPAVVLQTPGLPQIGSTWNFGNDIDVWAFCTPQAIVRQHQTTEGDRDFWWTVEQIFTTEPRQRCQDVPVENPLDEPDRVGGSFTKYVREVDSDRFGNRIENSAYQILEGPIVEFDQNHPTVWIEQNVPNLQLDTFSQMVDRVNGHPLWGLPPRKIKLSNVVWERMYFGQCNIFYKRTFEFDVKFDGFDRHTWDKGTKCIRGDWHEILGVQSQPARWAKAGNADLDNPADFDQFKDTAGEASSTLLDGNGCPWNPKYDCEGNAWPDPGIANHPPGVIDIEYYKEANFLILGIPLTL